MTYEMFVYGTFYWFWITFVIGIIALITRGICLVVRRELNGPLPWDIVFISSGGFVVAPFFFALCWFSEIYVTIYGKPVPGWRRWLYLPISLHEIRSEDNLTLRRELIAQYGIVRYIQNTKSEIIDQSEFGTLYQSRLNWDENIVMVKVKNSTPEPDGTYKDYFLRVPPHMRTAKEAVAWSFEKTEEQYSPVKET